MQRKFKNVKYIYFLSDLYKEMIEKWNGVMKYEYSWTNQGQK
jgi:hypothetical protein